MSNAIIVGGEPLFVGVPVKLWTDTKMEFAPGKGARKRGKSVDLIVLHVTGGEGKPDQVYRTLVSRGLGAEFIIGADGTIYQCCDPAKVDTFDAGHVNDRSIGVEIVNYGWTADAKLKAKWEPLREQYDTVIHERKLKMARSNNAQHAAMLALCDALTACKTLSIPRRIPRDKDGGILAQTMDRDALAKFSGVIGHLHITSAKIDPGTDVFDTLGLAGYK